MKETKWLCKLGIHKNKVIGMTQYPYMKNQTIIAFGCERCGKKSKHGRIVPTDIADSFISNIK